MAKGNRKQKPPTVMVPVMITRWARTGRCTYYAETRIFASGGRTKAEAFANLKAVIKEGKP